jgi:hypothetical protein
MQRQAGDRKPRALITQNETRLCLALSFLSLDRGQSGIGDQSHIQINLTY